MDSSWLGLDDFFAPSRRLSSRRHSRSRMTSSSGGVDAIKVDFGPRDLDLDLDAIFREFDTSFPRTRTDFKQTGAKTKSYAFTEKTSAVHKQKEDIPESEKPDSEFDSVRELRLKLQHSQEETRKLQAVITDLTQVNKRWQKYNSDRQIYVQKLLVTIQDQQEQLNLIGERSFPTPPPTSPSTANPTTSARSQSASSFTGVGEHELERLHNNEQKLKEKVSILEFQVKAHRDDWEAELNEKKQALKEKEIVERKLSELLSEMRLLTRSSECRDREGRLDLYCRHCGRAFDSMSPPPPSRSRLYRSAVTLPPSGHSSTTSISTTGDDTGIESRAQSSTEMKYKDPIERWNIRPDETSYSRCSTVPLVSPGSEPGGATMLRSFVQIPIAKSSSVPEGSALKDEQLRTALDSLKFSTSVSPVKVINSSEQDGSETLSAENVICLRCGEVFPPDMHLKFLDHFPKCQLRSEESTSSDSIPQM